MKTPDEIKKGLEYCVQLVCPLEECPYYDTESCAQDKTYDALAYIQQIEAANAELLTKVEQLTAKCHQLERERDALAADFKLYRERNIKGDCGAYACDLCKHGGKYEDLGENKCPKGCSGISHWEWRGVKEE